MAKKMKTFRSGGGVKHYYTGGKSSLGSDDSGDPMGTPTKVSSVLCVASALLHLNTRSCQNQKTTSL
jgi:hypothetical protein